MKQKSLSGFLIFVTLLLLSSMAFAADAPPSVQKQVYSLEDTTRHKKITVVAWYPPYLSNEKSTLPNQSQKSLPMIILSHGYMGSPDSLGWLAESLCEKNFIVLGVQHQDMTPDGKPYIAHWNRALDIRYVLSHLNAITVHNFIDRNKIGMVGYSLGTATGLWLAGATASNFERSINPGRQFVPGDEFPPPESSIAKELQTNTNWSESRLNYQEPLIKAVFLMAPGYGWAFDEPDLKKIKIPVFLVAAEHDEMLYPETNAFYFSKYIPHSAMKIIPDVGHFVFLASSKPSLGKFHYSDEERKSVHDEVSEIAVQFFSYTL